MDLLTDKGRAKLSLLLVLAVLLILFSAVFPNVKNHPANASSHALLAQLFAIGLLIMVVLKIDIRPTAKDLLEAAHELRKLEDREQAAWQNLKWKKLSFRELSGWKQATEIILIALGTVFMVLSLADFFEIGNPSFNLPGSSIHVPRFIMGIYEFLFGWGMYLGSRIFRHDLQKVLDFSRFKNVVIFPRKDLDH